MKQLLIPVVCLLAACAHVPQKEMEPVAAPQLAKAELAAPANGTILRDAREFSLFEDNRPTRVGDTLVVMINETVNASQKAKTTTDRKNDLSLTTPSITGLPGGADLAKIGVKSGAQNKFDGSGETSANNLFSGSITTIVNQVLPNGMLVIAGTKQINLHGEMTTLKFSGLVNPRNILSNGSVSSQNVAEVRVKYDGVGQINEAQYMGWLSRIFLNVLPL